MAATAQSTLPIQVTTPFGDGKVVLRTIQGQERISGLFQYTLELISAEKDLDFSKIVGKGVTVTMPLADGGNAYLHGIVGRFVQAGTGVRRTVYYADLHPALWLLTMSSDCRIFQNQAAPEIVKQVLKEQGVTDVQDSLTGTYAQREYCVQYMETNFDFISRLMEDEGIYYFFTHANGKHTLVLADDSSAHQPVVGYPTMRMRPSDAGWDDEGAILDCTFEQCPVTAKYKSDDYNFEVPSTDLLETSSGDGATTVYEFPAGRKLKADVESKTRLMLQGLEAHKQILRGSSSCRSFRPGAKFTLTGHERSSFNTDYVIRRVSFRGDQSSTFTNSFECQPLATPFRSARSTPRPRIYGSQTATVVGKSGEEIWTDKYGRVRLHFHWDQFGKSDEKDSCWVRVSQAWAGKQWGSLFLPRIGQEVVVSFLDGDPDRPIVTGSVYNAEQTLPYTLPDDQTKSTIKSNSSKGGGGFNEIRFQDKKNSEEFYIHAQKDYTAEVGNDQKVTIKNSRTTTIQEKDETLIVDKGDRAVKVNKGNETHDVKGKRDVTVTDKETHTNKADYTMKVSGDFTLKVDGDIKIEASGAVSIKSGKAFTNESGAALTNKSKGDLLNDSGGSLTNKAKMSLENNAGISLTNKASASQTVDGGGMLTVKGGMVKMN
ncbi:MAG: type VI secretion system tip protein TssI/VgrG [Bryobacteraceae bacterium]|jgi:type VI secretion system secreted protein VgrG